MTTKLAGSVASDEATNLRWITGIGVSALSIALEFRDGVAKGYQFGDLIVQVAQLPGEKILDVSAGGLACVPKSQYFPDLCQGQGCGPAAADEVQPVDRGLGVLPVPVRISDRSRQQSAPLIVPERLRCHPCSGSSFSDAHQDLDSGNPRDSIAMKEEPETKLQ
ncbi:hypothetical protein IWX78_003185 [Mycetocola sp. CAN_C7]